MDYNSKYLAALLATMLLKASWYFPMVNFISFFFSFKDSWEEICQDHLGILKTFIEINWKAKAHWVDYFCLFLCFFFFLSSSQGWMCIRGWRGSVVAISKLNSCFSLYSTWSNQVSPVFIGVLFVHFCFVPWQFSGITILYCFIWIFTKIPVFLIIN